MLGKQCKYSVFVDIHVFSQLFEPLCKRDPKKPSCFTPNLILGRPKVDCWVVLDSFWAMLKKHYFLMLFLNDKKSNKSRRGAPKGRQGEFEPSEEVPFSDFWSPGRPNIKI